MWSFWIVKCVKKLSASGIHLCLLPSDCYCHHAASARRKMKKRNRSRFWHSDGEQTEGRIWSRELKSALKKCFNVVKKDVKNKIKINWNHFQCLCFIIQWNWSAKHVSVAKQLLLRLYYNYFNAKSHCCSSAEQRGCNSQKHWHPTTALTQGEPSEIISI